MKYEFFAAFILTMGFLIPATLACYAKDAGNYWWYDYTYTSICEEQQLCPSAQTSGYVDFMGPGVDNACMVSPKGPYYSCSEPGGCCSCYLVNDVVWRYGATNSCPSGVPSTENGKVCKTRLSGACEYPVEGIWDAVDSDGNKCIHCSGLREDKICGDTAGIYDQYGTGICTKEGNKKCESACGANTNCDERAPGTSWCAGSAHNACDSNCAYCSGSGTGACGMTCCGDADCAGQTCEAEGFGARIKKCDTPTYSCKCGACQYNSDCVSQCCEKSPEINSDVNGDGRIEDCVPLGSVALSNKYLCASASPTGWHECDAANFAKTIKNADASYVCLEDNGQYEWNDVSWLKNVMIVIAFAFVLMFLVRKRF